MQPGNIANLPALERYLLEVYGGRFTSQTNTVTILTSLTLAINHDFERLALTFINVGTNDIHITPDQSATSSTGILLGGNGGFLSLVARDDLILVGYEWYGVASTATSNLEIISVVRYA